MKNTNIDSTVEQIEGVLKDFGFTAGRWPGWLEGVKSGKGFLRVVIDAGDQTMSAFKLTASSVMEWKLELSLQTPASILMAALTAAMDEANA